MAEAFTSHGSKARKARCCKAHDYVEGSTKTMTGWMRMTDLRVLLGPWGRTTRRCEIANLARTNSDLQSHRHPADLSAATVAE